MTVKGRRVDVGKEATGQPLSVVVARGLEGNLWCGVGLEWVDVEWGRG